MHPFLRVFQWRWTDRVLASEPSLLLRAEPGKGALDELNERPALNRASRIDSKFYLARLGRVAVRFANLKGTG